MACVARGSPLLREDVLRGRGLLIVGISFFLSGIRFVASAEASRVSLGNTASTLGLLRVRAMRTMNFMLREGLVTALNGFVLCVHTSNRRW